MNTVKPKISDYISLWLLKLAKSKRVSFESTLKDDYDKFYEDFFEEKDIAAYNLDKRMRVRRDTLNDYFSQHVKSGSVILDVGCGLGDVLNDIHEKFDYQLLGIDYAQRNVKIASERLKGKAEITQGNIYELPYKTGSIDAAVCLEVLEHIEDDERAIREICRVLKPGGVLIAAVPYTYYWPSYKRLLGHFRHYTRESFSQKMTSNGFSKVDKCLPNYHNWHQLYTKKYAFVRMQYIVFGRLFSAKSLYEFKYPWQNEPALEILWKKLEPLRMKDAEIDYEQEETSTFLVAKK